MNDNLENNLIRFNQKYRKKGNEIIIETGFHLNVHVIFENEKIEICPKLVGWNMLSGLIEMKLKSAVLYNIIASSISMFLILISSAYRFIPVTNLILIFLFVMIWTIGFILFYYVKSENLKTRIMYWLKND